MHTYTDVHVLCIALNAYYNRHASKLRLGWVNVHKGKFE